MEKYLDVTLSPKERAKDLLGKLSLEEKMAQINCFFGDHGDIETEAGNMRRMVCITGSRYRITVRQRSAWKMGRHMWLVPASTATYIRKS